MEIFLVSVDPNETVIEGQTTSKNREQNQHPTLV